MRARTLLFVFLAGCASASRSEVHEPPPAPSPHEIVAEVEARWRDSDFKTRDRDARRLLSLGTREALLTLARHMAEIPDWDTRNQALKRFAPEAAFLPGFEAGLAENEGKIKTTAWRAFEALVDAQSGTRVARAESLWPECHEAGRDALATYLLETQGPDASAALMRHFHEVSAELRAAIVKDFGDYLYDPGYELVGAALEDQDGGVRKAAEQALERLKHHRDQVAGFKASHGPDPVEKLLGLLESPNREVVIGAARSLGALKATAALPQLVQLLERDDPALREAVHEAISRIETP